MSAPGYGPTSRRRPAQWHAAPLPPNEHAWLEFIRLIWGGTAPPPTLRLVQAVTLACRQPELVLEIAAGRGAGNTCTSAVTHDVVRP